jgi:hypothetical protein
MLRPKRPGQSLNSSLIKQLEGKNNHANDEHEKANAVDPVHVAYIIRFRFIRLSQVEVL